MVVIDSQGWLYGKRIGRCSDAAQLHFGRLLNSSDGFGRIPLNTQYLHSTVYASFRKKPDEGELLGFFEEYKINDLAFIYESNGQIWCQWDVQEKYLPRYKSAKDKQSAAPDNQQLTEWKAGIRRKTLKTSEIFERLLKVPSSSEDFGTFPLVIGVGEVETHTPSSHRADGASPSSDSPKPRRSRKSNEVGSATRSAWFEQWYSLYPRKVARGQAEKTFAKFATGAAEFDTIMTGLRRQLPELLAQEVRFIPHPSTWLERKRWLDETAPGFTGVAATTDDLPTVRGWGQ